MVIHVQKDIEDMKKIYMSPVMDIVEIKQQQMLLAGSLPVEGTTDDASDADAPVFEFEENAWYDWKF